MKALGLYHGRFKLCVQVTLGQRGGQAMRLASRCLWDTATDKCVASRRACRAWRGAALTAPLPSFPCSYVSESYENDTLFASAQVFALYFE